MDLFQPVTLHLDEHRNPVSFNNLRLAVIAVMKELAPDQREKALIRGRDGQLDFSGIIQIYKDLNPLAMSY